MGDEGNCEPNKENRESQGAGHGNAPTDDGGLEDQRLGQRAPEDAGIEVYGGRWPSKGKAPGSQERGSSQAASGLSEEDLGGVNTDLIKRPFGAGFFSEGRWLHLRESGPLLFRRGKETNHCPSTDIA